ncbi:MAG: hypothetical protein EOO39_39225 [Cytophagaceae bacterium]|nr:MAG: hypothetical protein EOO39_39225 [Cytophagaceae bacterium]
MALLCLPTYLFAQKAVTLTLADLQSQRKLTIVNRDVSVGQEGARRYIKIEKELRPGQIPGKGDEGVIWLPINEFSQGTIELVARGRDILQGSFVGIAFHSVNDSTFDNVYCRPFNFRTVDPVRKIHAVQYIYMPKYDWQKLRAEQNGKYENGIVNPPAATDWFTLTVQVEGDNVKAFINHEESPSLEVKKLNQTSKGRVGLTGINYDIESVKVFYQAK